jgi:chemosensory pili system protein ChpA (sensor histidine kinase/response regulator)
MAQDEKELEIQLQFLDEAQDYLNIVEKALLGLADRQIDIQEMNAVLRAAHSIKGGAAMMGLQTLSELAHRMEDSFKVLKVQKDGIAIDAALEKLLLNGVDCLRRVVKDSRQGDVVDQQWLHTIVHPIFEQLHERLGEPQTEDVNSMLSQDEGMDITILLFETEVEGCLQRLETSLSTDDPRLREEVEILAQELEGLGDMLELSAFSQLCQSVGYHLAEEPERTKEIARLALEAWRRSQALVLTGHLVALPTAILEINIATDDDEPTSPGFQSDFLELDFLEEDIAIDATVLPNDPVLDVAAIAEVDPSLDTESDDLSLDGETDDTEILHDLIGLDWVSSTDDPDESVSADDWGQILEEERLSMKTLEEETLADFAIALNADQIASSSTQSLDNDHPITLDHTSFDISAEPSDASVVQSVDKDTQSVAKPVHPTPHQSVTAKAQTTPRETRATDFRVLDEPTTGVSQENTVRVPIKQLDQLNDLFGELTIERNQLDLEVKRLRNLIRSMSYRMQVLDQANVQLRTVYDNVATQTKTTVRFSNGDSRSDDHHRSSGSNYAHAGRSQQTAILPLSAAQNPDLGKFDALEMDHYGELHSVFQSVMETIVQLQEVTDDINLDLDDTEQTVRELNKTSKQLQTNLTQLRMRPLADVVDRFPRALRELSLQYGKSVQLKTYGTSTLVDRNILEALHDPLMHILRNAFDHGIEDAETRRNLGKPAEGLIEIRAFHRGDRTIITISDDGGGIPLDKIRTRALQMGLDKSLLAVASDDELLSLIFEPGFSTAEQVTTLSGRGVGMDVVRNNLKQVRGEVKVDTRAHVGTTFTISVPFTLSVTRVLLAESNGMLLAFPTDVIEEMLILQPDQIITTVGSTAFDWGGMMIQLIHLSQWLTFNCPRYLEGLDTPPTIDVPTVLMLKQNDEWIGLQIDRSWGEQEVAIRRVEGGLLMPPGFTNCTILGDGRVVPLVNVTELLHWIASYERSTVNLNLPELNFPRPTERQNALHSSPELLKLKPATPSFKPEAKSTILIVDDSIAVRRMLALTLENAGYQVVQAKDGQDALDKLGGGLQIQAAICDIEMPRLDGYGFLVKMKAMPDIAQLPIIMLTSRSGNKHRQLAMNLGAIAYFSKPYDERVLLQTIKQVIQLTPAI